MVRNYTNQDTQWKLKSETKKWKYAKEKSKL